MNHKIGTLVYLVHRNWKKQKSKESARVVPARVFGYRNEGGKVVPELRSGKHEYQASTNEIFTNLEDAIKAIT